MKSPQLSLCHQAPVKMEKCSSDSGVVHICKVCSRSCKLDRAAPLRFMMNLIKQIEVLEKKATPGKWGRIYMDGVHLANDEDVWTDSRNDEFLTAMRNVTPLMLSSLKAAMQPLIAHNHIVRGSHMEGCMECEAAVEIISLLQKNDDLLPEA